MNLTLLLQNAPMASPQAAPAFLSMHHEDVGLGLPLPFLVTGSAKPHERLMPRSEPAQNFLSQSGRSCKDLDLSHETALCEKSNKAAEGGIAGSPQEKEAAMF